MSINKFKELDYYGLAYFWNKINNKFALKGEIKITGSNGITVTMPTEDSGESIVVSYDNNDNIVNHISDNDIHVTSNDKANWADKYTKAEVDNKISGLVNSAPETLDTLNELASALGNDPNFATTIATQIGNKANSSDVYNKSETDTFLLNKTNDSDLSPVAKSGSYNDLVDKPEQDLSNYYNKAETNELLTLKASSSEVYTKTEVDNLLSNISVNSITNEEIEEICV